MHQDYRPTQQSPTNISKEHISKEPYSPSLYSTTSSAGQLSAGRGGCLSAPSAVTTFPHGVLNGHQPRFSTAEELVDLWEAANAQVPAETGKTFVLKMTRLVTLLSMLYMAS
jgi:hypothetical protein